MTPTRPRPHVRHVVLTCLAVLGLSMAAAQAQNGSLSGKVTALDGITPLANVSVTAYREDINAPGGWVFQAIVFTSVTGDYLFASIPAGTYRLFFMSPNHVDEYYNDQLDFDTATNIPLSSGGSVTNINASLAALGAISGTVTGGANGTTALTNLTATAYVEEEGEWYPFGTGINSAGGNYLVVGLPPGNYRMGFTATNHVPEFYNNAPSVESAADIVVTSGATNTNINASLALLPPVITDFTALGGGVYQLDFKAPPTNTYQLQQTGTLQSWTNYGPPIVSAPGVTTTNVTSTNAKNFWRVRTAP